MNTRNPEFCCSEDCHKFDFNDEYETISDREVLVNYIMTMTEAKAHACEDTRKLYDMWNDMWNEGNYKNEE